MEQQKISVIVPVYKVEPFLDRCVQSIVEQSYSNLEIILVDDGSPDNCPVMCDAWAVKDSRIKVLHKENGGLSDARNAGMIIASGELIGFVDSDDWVAPDMYQHLYNLIMEDHSDIATCGVEMVWEDRTSSRMLTKSGSCVLNRQEAMRALIEESWLKQPVWYKLYKTALIRDIHFPAGKYHEDVFWSYQAIARAERVSVSDYVGYFYVQRSGSIMGEGYSLKRLDAVEATVNWCAYAEEKFPELAGLVQGKLIGSCMYHNQLLLNNSAIDPDGSHQKWVQRQAGSAGIQWKKETRISQKQKIWMQGYLCAPNVVCCVRNKLGIGI